jgi:hypothetical protein
MAFLDEKVEEHGTLKVVPPPHVVSSRITDAIRQKILEKECDRVLDEAEELIAQAANARTEAVISNLVGPHDLYTFIRQTVNDDRLQHWTDVVDYLANSLIDEHGGAA